MIPRRERRRRGRAAPACLWLLLPALAAGVATGATPNADGQSGLIAMPDARTASEGALDLGVSYSGDEMAYFATLAAMPWLEATFEYSRFENVPIDAEGDGYRDKAFHLKLVALQETGVWPAIAIGATDLHGTRLFPSRYIAASRRLGDLDLTVGWGDGRIGGAFGGARWRPAWAGGIGIAVEHDAHRRAADRIAGLPIDPERGPGPTAALEYQARWWGVSATTEGDEVGGRAWLRFDFGRPGYAPKPDEPPPPTAPPPAPRRPAAEWAASMDPARDLARELYAQDFDSVDVALEGTTLRLRLTNRRISLMGRAVGRAARTALRYGPPDATALRIVYTRDRLPIATYAFSDLALLGRYFAGVADAAALAPTVSVTYASPADAEAMSAGALLLSDQPTPGLAEVEQRFTTPDPDVGDWLAFERSQPNVSSMQLKPLILEGYFNDIESAFHHDLFAGLLYWRELGAGVRVAGAARLTLHGNVDDVQATSSSTLPHVRSDVALYKREGPLKLDSLYLIKESQLGERLWARASAGIYEEMFAGAGGQVLWLPARGDWATDLTVEYARRRDYDGVGLLGYDAVTTIASLHYRFPEQGITVTARGGRFLAGDDGVRLEVKRRFRSGFVAGLWYTVTDGNDITGPGTPGDPYHDKGLFVSVPLSLAMRRDSRARGSFSLAPWSRDVGAMLRSPGDLYSTVEDALMFDTSALNPLSQFGR